MRDNVFKKIVSFALVAIMTLSLCSPGLVTSYATQDTDTTDVTDTTEQQTEAKTETETTVETQTETQTETESETKADKKEAESDSTENETAESYKEKEGSHVITEFLDAQDYYMNTGDADELINGMPEYLYALFDDGETARVYGSWDVVDNKEDGEDLILSMKFVLPLGYYVADGVDVPTVTMTGLGFYGVSAAKSSATKTGNTVSGKDEYTLKGSKQTRTALYIGTVKGSSKSETDYWKIYYGGGDVRERFHTPKMAGNNYAFCLHPELNAPTGDLKVYQLNDIYGTGLKFGTYTDKKAILKVLYYGHMDPEKTDSGRFKSSGLQKVLTDYMSNHTSDIFYDWNDNDDSNRTAKMSYFVTHCMAARAYGDATWNAGLNGIQKEAVNKVWDAMAKLADPPNPDVKIYKNDGKTSSSDNAWVTFSAKDGKTVVNRSHDFIVKCDASNSVTVRVPDKITLYKGKAKTGTTNANVTLKNGDTFHLEAAVTQTGTTTISGTGSHTTKYQVYIALDDAKAQDIVYLHASDSQGRNASFSVTWGTPREYRVKKVWDDSNNASGSRPSSVTLSLYYGADKNDRKKTKYTDVTLKDPDWSATVTGLPSAAADGSALYWGFYEDSVPSGYTFANGNGYAPWTTIETGRVFEATATNKANNGKLYIQKESADKTLTNNNSKYSLEGAEYTVYGTNNNGTLSNSKGKLTTDANGKSNELTLQPGKYYIKETKASTGFALDPTIYTVEVVAGKTVTASTTSKEPPLISMKVNKKWEDNNDQFKVRPSSITLDLYSGSSESTITTKAGKSVTLNASNNWSASITGLPQTDGSGKRIYYTFKESSVPANYTSTTSAVTKNSTSDGYEVTITNKIQKGYGKVQKVSTYTTITGGNNSYALTGAVYTIYTDANCTKKAIYDGTLTTTASGATNTVDLVPGTYYVKETTAPSGYKLDPKVYTLVITADNTTTINSKDVPLISLTVKKAWDDKNNKFQTRPTSLTVYLYSGGAANSLSKTDKYVTLNANNNWTASINDLPQTDDNGNTIYYSFKEDQVPLHYEQSVADTKMNTAKTGYDVTITNTLPTGYGQVQKVSFDTTLTNGNSKYPLNGAEYTIYTDQACTKKATYEGTMITMTDGKSNAIELVPGTYYVKETKAPTGYKEDPTVYTLVVTANKTTTFTSKEVPLVSLTVKKTWTDQENKFGVRPATLVVYLYSGSSEKNLTKTDRFVTLNAANKWTDTINNLPQTDDKGNRIYYGFKEEKTPEFYNETDSAATLTTAKNGYEVSITNELQTGYLKLLKTSLKPDLTKGNANYTLKDAVYTVYTDKECKNKAKYFGELKTDEKGATGTVELLPGTYYVKETTAPKGFKLSDEVFTVTVNDKATVNIDAVDTPIYSKLSLKKVSADEGRTNGLTDGNSCYSLEGAEYYVYTDAACKTRAKDSSGKDITLVTKADGTTNEAEVVAATYYIREMKASKGYYLDDCNTKTPHSVTLELGKNGSVTCTEKPMNDPFRVTMSKKSYKNGVEVTNNAPSLEGAIFEVDYYQNTDGKTSGAPDKKWYFKTDENGRFSAQNEKYYQSTATLDDGTVVTSDPLYRNEAGNPTYPLGTYTLREVKAPTYYEIKGSATIKGTGTTVDDPGKPLILVIKINPDTGKPGIYDGDKLTSGQVSVTNEVGITYNEEVYEGSLKVVKYGDDNKPLADVKFKLVGDDGSVYTGTTDKNGVYTFKELMPQHYVLTETETPDGSTLLKDNVDVNIPYEVSDQKAKDAKMDTSKAVHDASKNMYYFYDVTYNIKNGQAFPVVYTGGDQTMLYIGMTAALAMIGLGGYMVIRRRRER